MTILQAEHISKVYGKGENQIKALDDISFQVKKGEFVAIIGPSGSGKSTLLHMLGGVDRPTTGSVSIEDTDIFGLNSSKLAVFRRRQIGIIYQFYNLIPVLNVEENIALPLLLDGKEVNKKRMDNLLHILELEDRRTKLPNELSGGQQQRVSIGRALMNNPALLLADEPTGNLDSKNGAKVMELFKTCNRDFNQTIILITHDESIALMADRVISIEDGKIAKDEVLRPMGR